MLLLRFTAKPPLAAAALSVTVQASVAVPVIEEFAQLSPVTTGTPVPLRLMAAVLFVEELLAIVNVLLAAPAETGSNPTWSVAVWLGLKVSGKATPEMTKPLPERVAELTVTATVPVEESVIDCDAVELTATLPKLMLETLTVSAGMAALSCSA